MIFFILVIAFPILASAYFQLNNGNVALAGRLQEAGAALLFACVLFGWYMFFAIMLASLDFPWSLPGMLIFFLLVFKTGKLIIRRSG
jgi:1,4-dihydroxy-2-naphthoate octaprenyltransferase